MMQQHQQEDDKAADAKAAKAKPGLDWSDPNLNPGKGEARVATFNHSSSLLGFHTTTNLDNMDSKAT